MKAKIILLALSLALGGNIAAQDAKDSVSVSDTTVAKKRRGRLNRIDRQIQKTVFVPKGTIFGGFTISYVEQKYNNINMLLAKDIDGNGYTFGVSPFAGYFFRDNMAAGIRFAYNRTKVDLGNFDLNLGEDFKINLKDLYYLQHDYQISGFVRTYMALGKSKIFGFFNEMRLAYGHSVAKMSNGKVGDPNFEGTYSSSNYLHIGFAPGLTAFVQDWMAVEVQLGVLGFNFKWTDQPTNQVEKGSDASFSGKFNIDLFSINIGSTIYF